MPYSRMLLDFSESSEIKNSFQEQNFRLFTINTYIISDYFRVQFILSQKYFVKQTEEPF